MATRQRSTESSSGGEANNGVSTVPGHSTIEGSFSSTHSMLVIQGWKIFGRELSRNGYQWWDSEKSVKIRLEGKNAPTTEWLVSLSVTMSRRNRDIKGHLTFSTEYGNRRNRVSSLCFMAGMYSSVPRTGLIVEPSKASKMRITDAEGEHLSFDQSADLMPWRLARERLLWWTASKVGDQLNSILLGVSLAEDQETALRHNFCALIEEIYKEGCRLMKLVKKREGKTRKGRMERSLRFMGLFPKPDSAV